MIWVNKEGRNTVRIKHPGIKITELAKLCAETWRSMSKEKKEKWEKEAEELRKKEDKRYATAVAQVTTRYKRQPSAYMIWLNEEGLKAIKNNYPKCAVEQRISMCGRLWREMDNEEKKKWNDKANRLKENYEKSPTSIPKRKKKGRRMKSPRKKT